MLPFVHIIDSSVSSDDSSTIGKKKRKEKVINNSFETSIPRRSVFGDLSFLIRVNDNTLIIIRPSFVSSIRKCPSDIVDD